MEVVGGTRVLTWWRFCHFVVHFLGGETIMVHALRVFETLSPHLREFLSTRNYARQDPFEPNHTHPVRRPVYHRIESAFYCGWGIKYHRAFIEEGHRILNDPLSREDVALLNEFEAVLNQESFRHQFRLRSGEILFLNNNFICHDRTRFLDLGRRNRYLERYWAGQRLPQPQQPWG